MFKPLVVSAAAAVTAAVRVFCVSLCASYFQSSAIFSVVLILKDVDFVVRLPKETPSHHHLPLILHLSDSHLSKTILP